MADEIRVPSGAGRDIGVDAAGMMKSHHQASMKWVRELVNFPASKIQKEACKNGTPAKGDVCSGPEGVKGGQSLAREGQVINEHNARAPSPGLLFPLQMVQQLNSYEECLHVPLGSAAFAGSIPQCCETLGRKIATQYNSFTSKPLKEHIFPPLMDMLIYFNFFKAPFLVDLKKPELKMPHTVNFYIKVEPGVILGIWHTVPSCRGEDAKGKDRCWYEAALHDGNPIIVYFHGSAEHRAARHRLNLVKVLSDGGFHVLSVDYRGFGDSTGKPTEEGLTADAICVYEWTKARSGTTPVCLWGHSLGTGVVTNAARVLEEKGSPVDAIVLEAPFTNMWTASINYPLLKIYQKLPGFLQTLMDALRKDKIVFPNDENVKFLSSPLLILHGEDDRTVPLANGKQLYEIAHNAYRNKDRVKMVIFPPGFQHNLLCRSPTLLKTVRDFLSQQWA
ncbi:PREDICTED: abhydrolase domain-containing protein 12B [Myotis brandtii]|uniref:abhydrolase domain-containing protein 12B n=1 Tax=Myotis brandtii TaxID=109478 RepID=UPI0007046BCD|nr:PREDICTED: abhydrolase domain-containing protein 12B [Myotis brandtii]